MKKINDSTPYACPACGSDSFIQEGLAKFKEEVTISTGSRGMVIVGGCPELNIINSTIKCAECGADVE